MPTHRFLFRAGRAALYSAALLSATRALVGAETPAPAGAPAPDAVPAAANYQLRPTDLLRVEVVDDPRASREVRLAQDGTVRLAYLNRPVKLAGLTVEQATQAIQNFYTEGKVFVKPEVAVVIVQYSERHVQVVGQVNRPGLVVIPPEKEMTLVAAVAAAGHVTRTSSGAATIARTWPNGKTELIRVNVVAAMQDPKKDVKLVEGDTIHVKEGYLGLADL